SIVTVFPAIESLVKRYLRSNVSHFLIEQMKECLFYTASHFTIEEVESLTINEPLQSKDMDDEPDAINLSAKYLLDNLEQTKKKLIAQRWIPRDQRLNATKECTRLGQQFSNNVTNIDITSENNEYQFKWLQPFVDNELGETTNEVFINEMLFYGKVWSIAHTAVNKCVLHHDHEFVSLIKDYLNRVHIREDELIEQQETSTHTLSNLEGTTLVNSRKMVGKGRSKAASHKNTMNITLQEVDNILADFVRSQTIT
ncbi:11058_t:CDS:2, partial [Gigaspora rosea]